MDDQVIDLEKAEEFRSLKNGSNELLIKLLEKYLETAEVYIKKTINYVSSNDEENLFHVIHNFKGSSLTMGLIQISNILINVEKDVKQKKYENIAQNMIEIQKKLVSVKLYLSTLD